MALVMRGLTWRDSRYRLRTAVLIDPQSCDVEGLCDAQALELHFCDGSSVLVPTAA